MGGLQDLASPGPKRTQLSPEEEQAFMQWYATQQKMTGVSPDPDHPLHKYDWRGAYKAGIQPQIDPSDGLYHWSSQFKDPDHPNRFVNGIDTITGEAQPPGPSLRNLYENPNNGY